MYVQDDMPHPVVYFIRTSTNHVSKVVVGYFLLLTSAGSARRHCVDGLLLAARFNPAFLFSAFLQASAA